MKRGRAIGITGGFGCGKSSVAAVLRRMGVPLWDADEAVHERLGSDRRVIRAVARRFGAGVLGSDGGVRRDRLARVVFRDARARADLEAIVHPVVIADLRRWLAEQRRCDRTVAAVVPLLFEAGLENDFDAVACVVAPRTLVIERLRRRGVPAAEVRRRAAAQWPLRIKARQADYVLENRGRRADLAREVRSWWSRIQALNDRRTT